MKKYIIYILLLISASSTAQVKIGADGSMHPTGNYPTSVQRETKGYVLSVQSIVDRNAIPANFRDTGMIVAVRTDSSFYTLVGGFTNSDWVKLFQNGFSGSGIDSMFITTTDSIFIITTNNDTVYLGQSNQIRDTANLTFGYGLLVFDGNPYSPAGVDKAVVVDTVAIHNFIDSIIRTDTTISQNFGDIDYVVDTVSNSPPVQPDGYKVLVGTSPTGAFATHANQVATKVGGVYTYVTATTNQSLEVRNQTQLFFYKKTDFGWIRVSVADLIGGITGIVQPDIGTIDSNSFTIKTKNIPAITIDANQNIYNPKYTGLEDSNLFYKPGLNGLFDTGHFRHFEPGTNVTFTNSNDTTFINSTGGGGIAHVVATNGLNNVNDSTVALGGTLTGNTTITNGAFGLNVGRTSGSGSALSLTYNSVGSPALLATNTSGFAISAAGSVFAARNTSTLTNFALGASNTLGIALNLASSSTNSATPPAIIINNTQGTGIYPTLKSVNINANSGDGNGIYQDFALYGNDNSEKNSNRLLSRWYDFSNNISEFVLYGFSGSTQTDLLSLLGTGGAKLNQYTSGNFYQNDTASYKPMVIDASGNIFRSSWLGGGGGGGGSSLFPAPSGTGTATGDVTGELDGNLLKVTQSGTTFLQINPSSGNEAVLISPTDGVGSASLTLTANPGGYSSSIGAYDGINEIGINVDAVANSITHTAGTHIFNGNINLATTPSTYSTGGFDMLVRNQTTGDLELGASSGGWGTTGTVATLTGDATLDLASHDFSFYDNDAGAKGVVINNSAGRALTLGSWMGNNAYGAIWFGNVTPTQYNSTLASNGSDMYFGVVSNIYSIINGSVITAVTSGGLGVGTTSPAASALLDATSTTKGLLPPRMTTTQKNAISSPAEGLMVYDLTLHKLYVYDGTTWQAAW